MQAIFSSCRIGRVVCALLILPFKAELKNDGYKKILILYTICHVNSPRLQHICCHPVNLSATPLKLRKKFLPLKEKPFLWQTRAKPGQQKVLFIAIASFSVTAKHSSLPAKVMAELIPLWWEVISEWEAASSAQFCTGNGRQGSRSNHTYREQGRGLMPGMSEGE